MLVAAATTAAKRSTKIVASAARHICRQSLLQRIGQPYHTTAPAVNTMITEPCTSALVSQQPQHQHKQGGVQNCSKRMMLDCSCGRQTRTRLAVCEVTSFGVTLGKHVVGCDAESALLLAQRTHCRDRRRFEPPSSSQPCRTPAKTKHILTIATHVSTPCWRVQHARCNRPACGLCVFWTWKAHSKCSFHPG